MRGTLAAIPEADNFIEVRDGTYLLMDLNALARKEVPGLGKATLQDLEDVAPIILTEVCCVYARRESVDFVFAEETRGEALVVRWNHVSDHALTVLGIAPPELYINPLVLHHFIYFRQLLM